MKKKLLSGVIAASMILFPAVSVFAEEAAESVSQVLAAGDVAINEANFPDPVFREWLKDPWYYFYNETTNPPTFAPVRYVDRTTPTYSRPFDKNDDGVLSAAEIANITRIQLPYYRLAPPFGAESLKGIEYFHNLERLDVRGAPLKELDCQNSTLNTLILEDVTDLSTLDVSQNLKLSYLTIFRSNISSLDVSKNLELTDLGIWSMPITTLDLTQNSNLQVLIYADTLLTYIDLTNNPNLTRVSGNMSTQFDLDSVSQPHNIFNSTRRFVSVSTDSNDQIDMKKLVGGAAIVCI